MIDLGTGQSFNVLQVCKDNNIDYTQLTADNFYTSNVLDNGNKSWMSSDGKDYIIVNTTWTKSYNSSTGVLEAKQFASANYWGVVVNKTCNTHTYLIV